MTSVAIGYVHDNADLSHSWHASIQDLIGWHLAADDSTPQLAGQYVMRYGTDGLPGARNRVVQAFLAGDAEWLFWIDCDMGFAPDTAAMLVAAADPDERPIVGALCFAQKEVRPDGMGGWVTQPRPTIYDFVQTTDGRRGFVGRRDYPRDALLRCNATGSACLVVHRRVFEAIGGGAHAE